MSVPVRLAAFAVLLVVLGLAGFGVGSATGPIGPGGDAERHEPAHSSTGQDWS